MKFSFFKYQALGNSYLVIDPKFFKKKLNSFLIKKICDKNFGIGSDGILFGPLFRKEKKPILRIFNPDGSEAEKSGNGIRIFAKYLFDAGYLKQKKGIIITKGGQVEVQKNNSSATDITVKMGKLIFESKKIPVKTTKKEFINQKIKIGKKIFLASCVSIGNPHCIIFVDKLSKEEVLRYGPLIENYHLFPKKINVEFVKILSFKKIRLLVWERGVGWTLACGSGASASAGICYRLGLTGPKLEVLMEGGKAKIEISKNFEVKLRGKVSLIAGGFFSEEFFNF